ncbi:MAG TPA: glycoside hydrolase family 78 protein [Chitinophagaceae bacterium]|nr:glycoside hydrolase family 78 protein [Chitinophagaceae bacterium]
MINLLILISLSLDAQVITVYDLSCEYKKDPIGIGTSQPRLGWKIKSPERNVMQASYQINVATDPKFSKNGIVWESGNVSSGESILVGYKGISLEPGTRYFWHIKVWDNNSKESKWSEPAFFETGLWNAADWKAQWIEPVQDTTQYIAGPFIRKEVSLDKKISSARAYITSHGLYQFYINGEKVGDMVLTPGWTSYNKRLQYQVYDVTNLLQQGKNAFGAMLGDGWYRGPLGWVSSWGIYGKTLGLLAQIHIQYTDGSEETVGTNSSWRSTKDGPIIEDGIYDGEKYDARKEMPGWSKAGFDDSKWQPVHVASYDNKILIASQNAPMQKIQELKPIKIFKTPNGTLVADMGQNMVGWIRLKVKGQSGQTVTVRHAEVLDKYGEFYTKNLRAASASLKYTLKGNGVEVYEPHFTFMGFRYVALNNYPGELTKDDITGVVVHSDMAVSGSFACSDSLVNQLQHNIQWGQKGNFLDVPTDCPQRDERLGWTGDAQAFCRTAAFNMDVAPFFTKWLKDLAADQYADGQVPFVIPDVLKNNSGTSAGWGDVSTIAPWTMYKVYGDTQILKNQYESMKAYVDYIHKKAGDNYIWKNGSVFGDWLYYKPKIENHTEPDGYTNPDMIATAFYAYSAKLVSRAAGVLNNKEDEKTYNDIFEKVKEAFNKNYVTEEGRVFSDSQTGYVLALMFDLLPDGLRQNATKYLVDDIKRRGNHLSTGFLGTPYLCHVLSENGQTSVAYDLLLQQTFPSWLYPVKMGATTIWERWDGEKTDSTFQDEGMNSFNHYAYGAIGDWMYRVVAGIEIGSAGYKKIIIQPHPDRRLTYAKALYESVYGAIASAWKIKDGNLMFDVTIPGNTTATIRLPSTQIDKIKESGRDLSAAFKNVKQSGNDVEIEVGSGTYNFIYPASFVSK